MPAVSQVQQEMMGADLARARRGQPTRTGMSISQLHEFASTPRKGLPYRTRHSKESRRRKIAAIRSARR